MKIKGSIRKWFVSNVYADHNASLSVKLILNDLIDDLHKKDGVGINIGSGSTMLSDNILNLDIYPGDNIDIVGSVLSVPRDDESIDLVVSQEVLEHVDNPDQAMLEIKRILKPGGFGYIQLPFIIGYHPCPNDYWRFTQDGVRQLVDKAGLVVDQVGISVGSATGYYRVSVEFFAVLFSLLSSKLYIPIKGLFALILYPIKWLDYVFIKSNQNHRICGGHYVVFFKANNT